MQDKPASPPASCSAPGCDARLNRDNASGRCPRHRYVPVAGREVCAADGCEQPLRRDNRTGYCTPHKRAKNRGEVPKRDASGRVYRDRDCADCGEPFTPASATQQRCAECRPERRRALKRKQEWDTCSVPGCGAKLRASNKTDRCYNHRHYAPDRPVCAFDGCGEPLRKDNKSGFCKRHKSATARVPVRICAADGCGNSLRADNQSGFCGTHAWQSANTRAFRERYYAELREQSAERYQQRPLCSVDGCTNRLRSDNSTGRCAEHIYIPVPMEWDTCSVDGCGARIKPDNTLGRCIWHRALYWAGAAPVCGEPACGRTLHRDNLTGFCQNHRSRDEYNRDYYDRNADSLREYARQYREEHADEHRAAVSAWNAANRAARIAADSRRRMAGRAGMDDTDRLLSVCYRLAIQNDPCFYCGSPETAHVDHYFPLAKGGTDHFWNLVRACQPCNNAKYARCGTAFRLFSGG